MDDRGLCRPVIVDGVNTYREDVLLVHFLDIFKSVVPMNMILKEVLKVPLIPFLVHCTCVMTWIQVILPNSTTAPLQVWLNNMNAVLTIRKHGHICNHVLVVNRLFSIRQ
jgi:hypothetical protein